MEPMLDVRVEGEAGSIPALAFLDVLRTSLDLLDQLERAESLNSKPAGGWLIADLRSSSAVATLRRPDAANLQSHLRLVQGVGSLRQSEELPPYFSPDIAEGLVKIGRQLRQPGISGVTFVVPGLDGAAPVSEPVTEAVVTNAKTSVEGTDRAVGSVAGILDVINLRRGNHIISLYDEESRRAVRCKFPDEMFEVMKDALGHRIRALGVVTRNKRGQVLRVDIERVEALPDEAGAPSVDELAGIAPWFTGDQSTEDYLRSVRGA
ncbi:MAG TPA: hypothetical protein VFH54_07205 [Mycobacteriales bacterium]|nr:hypothetical protein [Mycobacteriales bacterium]